MPDEQLIPRALREASSKPARTKNGPGLVDSILVLIIGVVVLYFLFFARP